MKVKQSEALNKDIHEIKEKIINIEANRERYEEEK